MRAPTVSNGCDWLPVALHTANLSTAQRHKQALQAEPAGTALGWTGANQQSALSLLHSLPPSAPTQGGRRGQPDPPQTGQGCKAAVGEASLVRSTDVQRGTTLHSHFNQPEAAASLLHKLAEHLCLRRQAVGLVRAALQRLPVLQLAGCSRVRLAAMAPSFESAGEGWLNRWAEGVSAGRCALRRRRSAAHSRMGQAGRHCHPPPALKTSSTV